MNKKITGECFCGQVTYEIEGGLQDAKSCHCSRCRKAFSSQASSSAFLGDSEFKWLTGGDLLTDYVNKEGVGIQFCKVCGSTLSMIKNGVVIGVTLGSVNGDPEVEIERHIYVGSKAVWEKIPDGVIQFDKDHD